MEVASNYQLLRLSDIVVTEEDEKQFSSVTLSFSSKDSDVEEFLKSKAIQSTKLKTTATYIVTLKDAEQIDILGYFTLTAKILSVPRSKLFPPTSISGSKERKAFRIFSNQSEYTRTFRFPAILLAQFSKNTSPYTKSIAGKDSMFLALDKIKEIQASLGGRIVFLECNKNEKIISFYESVGFKVLEPVNYKKQKHKLIKMFKFL